MLILGHVQKRKLRRHLKRHITEMHAARLTGTVQSQCIRPLQSFVLIAIRVLLALMVTSLLHSLFLHSYFTRPNTNRADSPSIQAKPAWQKPVSQPWGFDVTFVSAL